MEPTRTAAPQPTLYDSWRAFVHFIRFFRRRLLWSFFLPFTLFFFISFLPTPKYKSESILMVRLGTEYIYQPEIARSAAAPSQLIPFDQTQIFKSEVAILNSRDLHQEVIRAMGPEKIFPQLYNLSTLHIFFIRIRELMHDFFAFIGLLHDEHLSQAQLQQREIAKAVAQFDKRFDIQLEKESAIITISFEHADATIANEVLNTLLTHFFEKRRDLYQDSRINLAQQQLAEKRKTMQAAQAKVEAFKWQHHIVDFAQQRSDLLHASEQLQAQSMVISHPGLAAKMAEYDKQIAALNANERALKELENEAAIAESAYALGSQNLDEARAYEDRQRQHANSVRVIQPPETPPYPKKWQKMIIVAGLFVSILCTLAVAAFSEFSRYAPRNRRASDRR